MTPAVLATAAVSLPTAATMQRCARLPCASPKRPSRHHLDRLPLAHQCRSRSWRTPVQQAPPSRKPALQCAAAPFRA